MKYLKIDEKNITEIHESINCFVLTNVATGASIEIKYELTVNIRYMCLSLNISIDGKKVHEVILNNQRKRDDVILFWTALQNLHFQYQENRNKLRTEQVNKLMNELFPFKNTKE